jgi:hypothetical protein
MDMKNYIKEMLEPIKPDPPGLDKLYTLTSYKNEYDKMFIEAMSKVKENVCKSVIETLKKELIGRTISMKNESGYDKIINVKDVKIGQKDNDFYPVIFENEEKKIRYILEDEKKSLIFFIDEYIAFFKKYYTGNLLMFEGKIMGSDINIKYTKKLIKIGIHKGKIKDEILCLDSEGGKYILNVFVPFKIMDEKIQELDPWGEEDWSN